MKNKFWLFALALVLILPLAFAFSGCKVEGSQTDDRQKQEQEETKTWTVTVHSILDFSVEVEDGALLPQQREPYLIGHRFDGWFADENHTTPFNFQTPITQDTEIWAKFTALYTVSFETNGGSEIDDVEVGDGETVSQPRQNPTKANYEFAGWFADQSLETVYDFSTPVTENTTIYAKWTKVGYTVSFDKTYEIIFDDLSDIFVGYDEWIMGMPKVDDAYASDFLGWYIPNSDRRIQNGEEIRASVTLEARFGKEPSGLYSADGKYAKTWTMLKSEYSEAISTNIINGSSTGSYFDNLSGKFVVDESIKEIAQRAFQSCHNLKQIILPQGLTKIGYYAFTNTSLTLIKIPGSVTSIGISALSGCSGLTSIVVEDGNTVYDSRGGCNAIIETATNKLIVGCKNTTIPSTVTSIGEYAFSSGLTSITIPNSVTSIGEYAFSSGLTSIVVEDGNTVYDSRGGCNAIIETAINKLIVGCKNTTIPNSVTSIGRQAFYGCSGLTSITIPNSVTSIGEYAFYYCRGLTSITIPNSVTSIGDDAFRGCSGLTSITIPDSVTSIGSFAFINCNALTSVVIPNSVVEINRSVFQWCYGLDWVCIPKSVTTIHEWAFYGCWYINDVYYCGTQQDWDNITIDETPFEGTKSGNYWLTNATIYYYSASKPTDDGNFWHYDTDGVTPVIWEEIEPSQIDAKFVGTWVFDDIYIGGEPAAQEYPFNYMRTQSQGMSVVINADGTFVSDSGGSETVEGEVTVQGDGITLVGTNSHGGEETLVLVLIDNKLCQVDSWGQDEMIIAFVKQN